MGEVPACEVREKSAGSERPALVSDGEDVALLRGEWGAEGCHGLSKVSQGSLHPLHEELMAGD